MSEHFFFLIRERNVHKRDLCECFLNYLKVFFSLNYTFMNKSAGCSHCTNTWLWEASMLPVWPYTWLNMSAEWVGHASCSFSGLMQHSQSDGQLLARVYLLFISLISVLLTVSLLPQHLLICHPYQLRPSTKSICLEWHFLMWGLSPLKFLF